MKNNDERSDHVHNDDNGRETLKLRRELDRLRKVFSIKMLRHSTMNEEGMNLMMYRELYQLRIDWDDFKEARRRIQDLPQEEQERIAENQLSRTRWNAVIRDNLAIKKMVRVRARNQRLIDEAVEEDSWSQELDGMSRQMVERDCSTTEIESRAAELLSVRRFIRKLRTTQDSYKAALDSEDSSEK